MKNILSHAVVAGLTVWLGFAAGTANAVPVLQLGIVGGTYDSATQTVVATTPAFSLYAFLAPNSSNTLSDSYYLSMAITPQVSTPANLGSFTYNSTTVAVTSGMTYGYPPIDTFSAGADPGDLAAHSVFPTYFKEVGFSFSSSNQSGIFNTQDNPIWGPRPGSGMYFNRFDFDTSNLAVGYAVHFDLYNTKLCINGRGPCSGNTDTDITQFAPFSHDAQSMISAPHPAIPEPETYAMLLAGLGLLGLAAGRRKPGA
ncbi:MAG: hypothetical protein FD134_1277 [Gallionellaceae bacterium]|nr:MAG: hypothetical protein FD134_1277 [Gallionellaceae bacterium]